MSARLPSYRFKGGKYARPFQFKVGRILGESPAPPRVTGQIDEAPGDELQIINGQLVRSDNEWFVYKALLKLGVKPDEIGYQEYMDGGRLRGGQVVDFIIRRGVVGIAINVKGAYWHPGEYGTFEDVLHRASLIEQGYIVEDIWDWECMDIESAAFKLGQFI